MVAVGRKMLRILFFGSLAEQAGSDTLLLAWQDDWHTVQDVMTALRQSHPHVAALLAGRRGLLIAVNQQVVRSDARIIESDELAFLPPVTGG